MLSKIDDAYSAMRKTVRKVSKPLCAIIEKKKLGGWMGEKIISEMPVIFTFEMDMLNAFYVIGRYEDNTLEWFLLDEKKLESLNNHQRFDVDTQLESFLDNILMILRNRLPKKYVAFCDKHGFYHRDNLYNKDDFYSDADFITMKASEYMKIKKTEKLDFPDIDSYCEFIKSKTSEFFGNRIGKIRVKDKHEYHGWNFELHFRAYDAFDVMISKAEFGCSAAIEIKNEDRGFALPHSVSFVNKNTITEFLSQIKQNLELRLEDAYLKEHGKGVPFWKRGWL